jgi:hypothetical protein
MTEKYEEAIKANDFERLNFSSSNEYRIEDCSAMKAKF